MLSVSLEAGIRKPNLYYRAEAYQGDLNGSRFPRPCACHGLKGDAWRLDPVGKRSPDAPSCRFSQSRSTPGSGSPRLACRPVVQENTAPHLADATAAVSPESRGALRWLRHTQSLANYDRITMDQIYGLGYRWQRLVFLPGPPPSTRGAASLPGGCRAFYRPVVLRCCIRVSRITGILAQPAQVNWMDEEYASKKRTWQPICVPSESCLKDQFMFVGVLLWMLVSSVVDLQFQGKPGRAAGKPGWRTCGRTGVARHRL